MQVRLSKLFRDFFESEKTAGLILILCTIVSLVLTNFLGHSYSGFWHVAIFSKPLEFWINDGLMTIFFLLVGLEIEREIYRGELSDVKKSHAADHGRHWGNDCSCYHSLCL